MSDEYLQTLRRQALAGDTRALTKLEAEIFRRRDTVVTTKNMHVEEIEVHHPLKTDRLQVMVTVVGMWDSNKIKLRVCATREHRLFSSEGGGGVDVG